MCVALVPTFLLQLAICSIEKLRLQMFKRIVPKINDYTVRKEIWIALFWQCKNNISNLSQYFYSRKKPYFFKSQDINLSLFKETFFSVRIHLQSEVILECKAFIKLCLLKFFQFFLHKYLSALFKSYFK